ncbi:MAG: UDP-2,3-diacylglucosamine diphosphatase [bacterium]
MTLKDIKINGAESSPIYLFASDMHLDDLHPHRTQTFVDSISSYSQQLTGLYLLGDLFEAWIGDDAPGDCGKILIKLLSELQLNGVKCHIMHGNRDFLLGSDFIQQSGCILLDDPTIIELDGQRILLSHGDQYCLDDQAYQQVRTMLRSSSWQQEFLSHPIAIRQQMAQQARSESKKYQHDLDAALMDVNQQAIESALTQAKADIMIHGHTHRPDQHTFKIGTQSYHRYVLGDWYADQPGMMIAIHTQPFSIKTIR